MASSQPATSSSTAHHPSIIRQTADELLFNVTELDSFSWHSVMVAEARMFLASDPEGSPCSKKEPSPRSPGQYLTDIGARKVGKQSTPQPVPIGTMPSSLQSLEIPVEVMEKIYEELTPPRPHLLFIDWKNGEIRKADVFGYRPWSRIAPFYMTAYSRRWAIQHYGHPSRDSFPFNPKKDRVVVFDDQLSPWRLSATRFFWMTNPSNIFQRIRHAEDITLYAPHLQNHRRLRSVLLWPGLKHLTLEMQRYDSCSFTFVTRKLDEASLIPCARPPPKRVYLETALQFLDTFLWGYARPDRSEVKHHLLLNLETLRFRAPGGPGGVCWEKVRNQWDFLRWWARRTKLPNWDMVINYDIFRQWHSKFWLRKACYPTMAHSLGTTVISTDSEDSDDDDSDGGVSIGSYEAPQGRRLGIGAHVSRGNHGMTWVTFRGFGAGLHHLHHQPQSQ